MLKPPTNPPHQGTYTNPPTHTTPNDTQDLSALWGKAPKPQISLKRYAHTDISLKRYIHKDAGHGDVCIGPLTKPRTPNPGTVAGNAQRATGYKKKMLHVFQVGPNITYVMQK